MGGACSARRLGLGLEDAWEDEDAGMVTGSGDPRTLPSQYELVYQRRLSSAPWQENRLEGYVEEQPCRGRDWEGLT